MQAKWVRLMEIWKCKCYLTIQGKRSKFFSRFASFSCTKKSKHIINTLFSIKKKNQFKMNKNEPILGI
jgi:hypothetical protein